MAIRPYILTETNWDSLRHEKFELAVLPWGATEAHNYHLPYGTDVIESDHIAAEAAAYAWEKGGKVIVLPTIPFGVNTGQADIYLDINLNPSTQMAILADVITTLNRQGIYKLLIFNSHGGNNFKALVRELGLKFPEMFICFSNWFQSMDRGLYFREAGDHADEMETSLLLYLKPEWVLPKEKWGKERLKNIRSKHFPKDGYGQNANGHRSVRIPGLGIPCMPAAKKELLFSGMFRLKWGNCFWNCAMRIGNHCMNKTYFFVVAGISFLTSAT